MRGGVTEADILFAWRGLAKEEASRKKSPMEPEDKEQYAYMGLLYAIRTYRIGMRPFEGYARDCVRAYLTYYDRRYRMSKRAESQLSLDMPVKLDGEGTATFADFLLSYEEPAFA